jgi:GT2 family glycosyltransferase
MEIKQPLVYCVVPNWNGAETLGACLDSLLIQTLRPRIIVVENGSTDGSNELLGKYPSVEIIVLGRNHGFAGGVNAGIKRALEEKADFVALFNNDAVADKNWLKNLVDKAEKNPKLGIVTSKILNNTGEYLDSTGEGYTTWGLPCPRGRREAVTDKYDKDTKIFAASGGASLYRTKTLEEIGLFDENFFAYYEDVDLSFRAQLAGWRVAYTPRAVVYHQIGATSSKISGFSTYHTMKNLPWLFWKNVPRRLIWRMAPRFKFAYFSFYVSAVARGQGWPATKGFGKMLLLLPYKLIQRRKIQSRRKVSANYIDSILTHDLPPNAHKLRALRDAWWKLRRKKAA